MHGLFSASLGVLVLLCATFAAAAQMMVCDITSSPTDTCDNVRVSITTDVISVSDHDSVTLAVAADLPGCENVRLVSVDDTTFAGWSCSAHVVFLKPHKALFQCTVATELEMKETLFPFVLSAPTSPVPLHCLVVDITAGGTTYSAPPTKDGLSCAQAFVLPMSAEYVPPKAGEDACDGAVKGALTLTVPPSGADTMQIRVHAGFEDAVSVTSAFEDLDLCTYDSALCNEGIATLQLDGLVRFSGATKTFTTDLLELYACTQSGKSCSVISVDAAVPWTCVETVPPANLDPSYSFPAAHSTINQFTLDERADTFFGQVTAVNVPFSVEFAFTGHTFDDASGILVSVLLSFVPHRASSVADSVVTVAISHNAAPECASLSIYDATGTGTDWSGSVAAGRARFVASRLFLTSDRDHAIGFSLTLATAADSASAESFWGHIPLVCFVVQWTDGGESFSPSDAAEPLANPAGVSAGLNIEANAGGSDISAHVAVRFGLMFVRRFSLTFSDQFTFVVSKGDNLNSACDAGPFKVVDVDASTVTLSASTPVLARPGHECLVSLPVDAGDIATRLASAATPWLVHVAVDGKLWGAFEIVPYTPFPLAGRVEIINITHHGTYKVKIHVELPEYLRNWIDANSNIALATTTFSSHIVATAAPALMINSDGSRLGKNPITQSQTLPLQIEVPVQTTKDWSDLPSAWLGFDNLVYTVPGGTPDKFLPPSVAMSISVRGIASLSNQDVGRRLLGKQAVVASTVMTLPVPDWVYSPTALQFQHITATNPGKEYRLEYSHPLGWTNEELKALPVLQKSTRIRLSATIVAPTDGLDAVSTEADVGGFRALVLSYTSDGDSHNATVDIADFDGLSGLSVDASFPACAGDGFDCRLTGVSVSLQRLFPSSVVLDLRFAPSASWAQVVVPRAGALPVWSQVALAQATEPRFGGRYGNLTFEFAAGPAHASALPAYELYLRLAGAAEGVEVTLQDCDQTKITIEGSVGSSQCRYATSDQSLRCALSGIEDLVSVVASADVPVVRATIESCARAPHTLTHWLMETGLWDTRGTSFAFRSAGAVALPLPRAELSVPGATLGIEAAAIDIDGASVNAVKFTITLPHSAACPFALPVGTPSTARLRLVRGLLTALPRPWTTPAPRILRLSINKSLVSVRAIASDVEITSQDILAAHFVSTIDACAGVSDADGVVFELLQEAEYTGAYLSTEYRFEYGPMGRPLVSIALVPANTPTGPSEFPTHTFEVARTLGDDVSASWLKISISVNSTKTIESTHAISLTIEECIAGSSNYGAAPLVSEATGAADSRDPPLRVFLWFDSSRVEPGPADHFTLSFTGVSAGDQLVVLLPSVFCYGKPEDRRLEISVRHLTLNDVLLPPSAGVVINSLGSSDAILSFAGASLAYGYFTSSEALPGDDAFVAVTPTAMAPLTAQTDGSSHVLVLAIRLLHELHAGMTVFATIGGGLFPDPDNVSSWALDMVNPTAEELGFVAVPQASYVLSAHAEDDATHIFVSWTGPPLTRATPLRLRMPASVGAAPGGPTWIACKYDSAVCAKSPSEPACTPDYTRDDVTLSRTEFTPFNEFKFAGADQSGAALELLAWGWRDEYHRVPEEGEFMCLTAAFTLGEAALRARDAEAGQSLVLEVAVPSSLTFRVGTDGTPDLDAVARRIGGGGDDSSVAPVSFVSAAGAEVIRASLMSQVCDGIPPVHREWTRCDARSVFLELAVQAEITDVDTRFEFEVALCGFTVSRVGTIPAAALQGPSSGSAGFAMHIYKTSLESGHSSFVDTIALLSSLASPYHSTVAFELQTSLSFASAVRRGARQLIALTPAPTPAVYFTEPGMAVQPASDVLGDVNIGSVSFTIALPSATLGGFEASDVVLFTLPGGVAIGGSIEAVATVAVSDAPDTLVPLGCLFDCKVCAEEGPAWQSRFADRVLAQSRPAGNTPCVLCSLHTCAESASTLDPVKMSMTIRSDILVRDTSLSSPDSGMRAVSFAYGRPLAARQILIAPLTAVSSVLPTGIVHDLSSPGAVQVAFEDTRVLGAAISPCNRFLASVTTDSALQIRSITRAPKLEDGAAVLGSEVLAQTTLFAVGANRSDTAASTAHASVAFFAGGSAVAVLTGDMALHIASVAVFAGTVSFTSMQSFAVGCPGQVGAASLHVLVVDDTTVLVVSTNGGLAFFCASTSGNVHSCPATFSSSQYSAQDLAFVAPAQSHGRLFVACALARVCRVFSAALSSDGTSIVFDRASVFPSIALFGTPSLLAVSYRDSTLAQLVAYVVTDATAVVRLVFLRHWATSSADQVLSGGFVETTPLMAHDIVFMHHEHRIRSLSLPPFSSVAYMSFDGGAPCDSLFVLPVQTYMCSSGVRAYQIGALGQFELLSGGSSATQAVHASPDGSVLVGLLNAGDFYGFSTFPLVLFGDVRVSYAAPGTIDIVLSALGPIAASTPSLAVEVTVDAHLFSVLEDEQVTFLDVSEGRRAVGSADVTWSSNPGSTQSDAVKLGTVSLTDTSLIEDLVALGHTFGVRVRVGTLHPTPRAYGARGTRVAIRADSRIRVAGLFSSFSGVPTRDYFVGQEMRSFRSGILAVDSLVGPVAAGGVGEFFIRFAGTVDADGFDLVLPGYSLASETPTVNATVSFVAAGAESSRFVASCKPHGNEPWRIACMVVSCGSEAWCDKMSDAYIGSPADVFVQGVFSLQLVMRHENLWTKQDMPSDSGSSVYIPTARRGYSRSDPLDAGPPLINQHSSLPRSVHSVSGVLGRVTRLPYVARIGLPIATQYHGGGRRDCYYTSTSLSNCVYLAEPTEDHVLDPFTFSWTFEAGYGTSIPNADGTPELPLDAARMRAAMARSGFMVVSSRSRLTSLWSLHASTVTTAFPHQGALFSNNDDGAVSLSAGLFASEWNNNLHITDPGLEAVRPFAPHPSRSADQRSVIWLHMVHSLDTVQGSYLITVYDSLDLEISPVSPLSGAALPGSVHRLRVQDWLFDPADACQLVACVPGSEFDKYTVPELVASLKGQLIYVYDWSRPLASYGLNAAASVYFVFSNSYVRELVLPCVMSGKLTFPAGALGNEFARVPQKSYNVVAFLSGDHPGPKRAGGLHWRACVHTRHSHSLVCGSLDGHMTVVRFSPVYTAFGDSGAYADRDYAWSTLSIDVYTGFCAVTAAALHPLETVLLLGCGNMLLPVGLHYDTIASNGLTEIVISSLSPVAARPWRRYAASLTQRMLSTMRADSVHGQRPFYAALVSEPALVETSLASVSSITYSESGLFAFVFGTPRSDSEDQVFEVYTQSFTIQNLVLDPASSAGGAVTDWTVSFDIPNLQYRPPLYCRLAFPRGTALANLTASCPESTVTVLSTGDEVDAYPLSDATGATSVLWFTLIPSLSNESVWHTVKFTLHDVTNPLGASDVTGLSLSCRQNETATDPPSHENWWADRDESAKPFADWKGSQSPRESIPPADIDIDPTSFRLREFYAPGCPEGLTGDNLMLDLEDAHTVEVLRGASGRVTIVSVSGRFTTDGDGNSEFPGLILDDAVLAVFYHLDQPVSGSLTVVFSVEGDGSEACAFATEETSPTFAESLSVSLVSGAVSAGVFIRCSPDTVLMDSHELVLVAVPTPSFGATRGTHRFGIIASVSIFVIPPNVYAGIGDALPVNIDLSVKVETSTAMTVDTQVVIRFGSVIGDCFFQPNGEASYSTTLAAGASSVGATVLCREINALGVTFRVDAADTGAFLSAQRGPIPIVGMLMAAPVGPWIVGSTDFLLTFTPPYAGDVTASLSVTRNGILTQSSPCRIKDGSNDVLELVHTGDAGALQFTLVCTRSFFASDLVRLQYEVVRTDGTQVPGYTYGPAAVLSVQQVLLGTLSRGSDGFAMGPEDDEDAGPGDCIHAGTAYRLFGTLSPGIRATLFTATGAPCHFSANILSFPELDSAPAPDFQMTLAADVTSWEVFFRCDSPGSVFRPEISSVSGDNLVFRGPSRLICPGLELRSTDTTFSGPLGLLLSTLPTMTRIPMYLRFHPPVSNSDKNFTVVAPAGCKLLLSTQVDGASSSDRRVLTGAREGDVRYPDPATLDLVCESIKSSAVLAVTPSQGSRGAFHSASTLFHSVVTYSLDTDGTDITWNASSPTAAIPVRETIKINVHANPGKRMGSSLPVTFTLPSDSHGCSLGNSTAGAQVPDRLRVDYSADRVWQNPGYGQFGESFAIYLHCFTRGAQQPRISMTSNLLNTPAMSKYLLAQALIGVEFGFDAAAPVVATHSVPDSIFAVSFVPFAIHSLQSSSEDIAYLVSRESPAGDCLFSVAEDLASLNVTVTVTHASDASGPPVVYVYCRKTHAGFTFTVTALTGSFAPLAVGPIASVGQLVLRLLDAGATPINDLRAVIGSLEDIVPSDDPVLTSATIPASGAALLPVQLHLAPFAGAFTSVQLSLSTFSGHCGFSRQSARTETFEDTLQLSFSMGASTGTFYVGCTSVTSEKPYIIVYPMVGERYAPAISLRMSVSGILSLANDGEDFAPAVPALVTANTPYFFGIQVIPAPAETTTLIVERPGCAFRLLGSASNGESPLVFNYSSTVVAQGIEMECSEVASTPVLAAVIVSAGADLAASYSAAALEPIFTTLVKSVIRIGASADGSFPAGAVTEVALSLTPVYTNLFPDSDSVTVVLTLSPGAPCTLSATADHTAAGTTVSVTVPTADSQGEALASLLCSVMFEADPAHFISLASALSSVPVGASTSPALVAALAVDIITVGEWPDRVHVDELTSMTLRAPFPGTMIGESTLELSTVGSGDCAMSLTPNDLLSYSQFLTVTLGLDSSGTPMFEVPFALRCGSIVVDPAAMPRVTATRVSGAPVVSYLSTPFEIYVQTCDSLGSFDHGRRTIRPGPFGDMSYRTVAVYRCDHGFDLVFFNASRCIGCTHQIDCSLSGWTDGQPSCEIHICGAAPAYDASWAEGSVPIVYEPERSGEDAENHEYDARATYACVEGYHLNSGVETQEITCTADGWSQTDHPQCRPLKCTSLDPPVNAHISEPAGETPTSEFYFPIEVKFECDAHFSYKTGSLSRTCQADGSWSGTALECESSYCSADVTLESGRMTFSTPIKSITDADGNTRTVYIVGTRVTFACETGFKPIYDSADDPEKPYECTATGWVGPKPSCSEVECPAISSGLDPVKHFYVSQTNPAGTSFDVKLNKFGAIATYVCEIGFTSSTALTRTCEPSASNPEAGQWSGVEPVCAIHMCGTPPAVANGQFELIPHQTNPPMSYDTKAKYTCTDGYNLAYTSGVTDPGRANASVLLSCTLTGWPTALPTCTINNCGTPTQISNGNVVSDGTVFGSTAVYACDQGYRLHTAEDTPTHGATLTRRCGNSESNWSPQTPYCRAVECDDLSPIAVGGGNIEYEDTGNGPTSLGAIARYTCAPGYALSRRDIYRECMYTEAWAWIGGTSADIPTCNDIDECDVDGAGFVDCAALYGHQSRCINTVGSYVCTPFALSAAAVLSDAERAALEANPDTFVYPITVTRDGDIMPANTYGGQTIAIKVFAGVNTPQELDSATGLLPTFAEVRFVTASPDLEQADFNYACTSVRVSAVPGEVHGDAGPIALVQCTTHPGAGQDMYMSLRFCIVPDISNSSQLDCTRWNWDFGAADVSDTAAVNSGLRLSYHPPMFVTLSLRSLTYMTDRTMAYSADFSAGELVALDVDNLYLGAPQYLSVSFGLYNIQNASYVPEREWSCEVDLQASLDAASVHRSIACRTPDDVDLVDLRFKLTLMGRSTISPDTYSYPVTPIITSVSGCPDSTSDPAAADADPHSTWACPTRGAFPITIAGTGFAEPLSAMVNGLPCEVLERTSTVVTCSLPPGTGAALTVLIKTGAKRAELRGALAYAAPVISRLEGCTRSTSSAVYIHSCPRPGGTPITISGTNFGPAGATVTVGGVTCTSPSMPVPHEQIVCRLPSGGSLDQIVSVFQRYGDLSRTEAYVSYEMCPTGTYGISSNCIPCPKGSYNDAVAQLSCKLCNPGTYTSLSGRTQCDVCGSGTYSSLGASECTSCSRGKFSQPNSDTCSACAPGTYSDREGLSICSNCPFDAQSLDDFTYCQCKPGTYSGMDGTCKACLAGGDCRSAGTDLFNIVSLPSYSPSVYVMPRASVRRLYIGLALPVVTEEDRRSITALVLKLLFDNTTLPRGPIRVASVDPAAVRQAAQSEMHAPLDTAPASLNGARVTVDVTPMELEELSHEEIEAVILDLFATGSSPAAVHLGASYGGPVAIDAQFESKPTFSFQVCLNNACSGGDQCIEGHSGTLCTVCLPGYGKTSVFKCAKCADFALRTAVFVIGIVAAIALCGVLAWRQILDGRQSTSELPAPAIPIIFKIAVSGLQVMAIAARYDLRWPGVLEGFFDAADTAGGVGTAIISLDCFLPAEPVLRPFWITSIGVMLLPLLGVMLPAMVFGPMYFRTRRLYTKQLQNEIREHHRMLVETHHEYINYTHARAHRIGLVEKRRVKIAAGERLVNHWDAVSDQNPDGIAALTHEEMVERELMRIKSAAEGRLDDSDSEIDVALFTRMNMTRIACENAGSRHGQAVESNAGSKEMMSASGPLAPPNPPADASEPDERNSHPDGPEASVSHSAADSRSGPKLVRRIRTKLVYRLKKKGRRGSIAGSDFSVGSSDVTIAEESENEEDSSIFMTHADADALLAHRPQSSAAGDDSLSRSHSVLDNDVAAVLTHPGTPSQTSPEHVPVSSSTPPVMIQQQRQQQERMDSVDSLSVSLAQGTDASSSLSPIPAGDGCAGARSGAALVLSFAELSPLPSPNHRPSDALDTAAVDEPESRQLARSRRNSGVPERFDVPLGALTLETNRTRHLSASKLYDDGAALDADRELVREHRRRRAEQRRLSHSSPGGGKDASSCVKTRMRGAYIDDDGQAYDLNDYESDCEPSDSLLRDGADDAWNDEGSQDHGLAEELYGSDIPRRRLGRDELNEELENQLLRFKRLHAHNVGRNVMTELERLDATNVELLAAIPFEDSYESELLRNRVLRRERAIERVRQEKQLRWYKNTYGREAGRAMFDEERRRRLHKSPPRLTPAEMRRRVDVAEARFNHVESEYLGYMITTLTVVLFLIHPNITRQFFTMLSCKQLGGDEDPNANFLLGDMTQLCYSSQHVLFITAVALPMFVLWVFGIPCFAFVLLYRNRALIQMSGAGISSSMRAQKRVFESQMAFLYRGYVTTRYYWFLAELVRKALLVAIAVFFPGALHTQLLLASLLIFVAILAQIWARPFENRITENLELMSLFVSFMIFFLANFLFVNDLASGAYEVITVLIFALVLLFAIAVVVAFILVSRQELALAPLRRLLRQAHVKGHDTRKVLRQWRLDQQQKNRELGVTNLAQQRREERKAEKIAEARRQRNDFTDAMLVVDTTPDARTVYEQTFASVADPTSPDMHDFHASTGSGRAVAAAVAVNSGVAIGFADPTGRINEIEQAYRLETLELNLGDSLGDSDDLQALELDLRPQPAAAQRG